MFRWMFRKYLNRNPASVKDNGRAGKRGGRQNRTSMASRLSVGAKTKFKTQENVRLTKIIVQAYSVEMPPNSAAQNCQFWQQFHQLLYSSSYTEVGGNVARNGGCLLRLYSSSIWSSAAKTAPTFTSPPCSLGFSAVNSKGTGGSVSARS
jgi:hypothetical protein